MQDRTPLYPGRVKLVPVEGQTNVYDMTREDSPTQPGTPMSKATFLKDATAALFGLGSDAVPDDALALLSRFHKELGNEYLWKKSKTEEFEDIVELTNVEIWRGESGKNNTFYVGTGFTNSSGSTTYPYRVTGLTNFSAYSQSAYSVTSNFLGKYISADSVLNTDGSSTKEKGVYYIPTDATVTHTEISSTGTRVYSLTVSKVIATRNHRFLTTEYGYVNSQDPNAYPPAVSDGYTYTALGQVGSRTQIETGTYVGTGNNACSIQYERTPKFVAIFSKTTTNSSDEIPFAFFMPEIGVGVLTYPKRSQQNYCYVATCYLRDNAFKTSNSYMDISGRTYQYIMLS